MNNDYVAVIVGLRLWLRLAVWTETQNVLDLSCWVGYKTSYVVWNRRQGFLTDEPHGIYHFINSSVIPSHPDSSQRSITQNTNLPCFRNIVRWHSEYAAESFDQVDCIQEQGSVIDVKMSLSSLRKRSTREIFKICHWMPRSFHVRISWNWSRDRACQFVRGEQRRILDEFREGDWAARFGLGMRLMFQIEGGMKAVEWWSRVFRVQNLRWWLVLIQVGSKEMVISQHLTRMKWMSIGWKSEMEFVEDVELMICIMVVSQRVTFVVVDAWRMIRFVVGRSAICLTARSLSTWSQEDEGLVFVRYKDLRIVCTRGCWWKSESHSKSRCTWLIPDESEHETNIFKSREERIEPQLSILRLLPKPLNG